MKLSLILAHPYAGSFNHAIAHAAADALRSNGHAVSLHDLYAENFNPVITARELVSDVSDDPLVQAHCREIKAAEGLVIVHPNWWGQPPAILKGWVDRVLRNGVAYTFGTGDDGGGLPVGLLRIKNALVLNTSNTPEARENEVFGDPLERIWKDCVFGFCGINGYARRMYAVVVSSTLEQRRGWLADAGKLAGEIFPRG